MDFGSLFAQSPSLSEELIRDQLDGLTPEEYEKKLLERFQGGGETKPAIEIENASEGEFLKGEEDENGLLILRGRIRVRLPSGVFTANTVVVDGDRQELFGEGNLLYEATEGERYTVIRAERIIYNQKLESGILYNAEGYSDPVSFVGKSLQRTSTDRFSVSHATFTTCTAKRPHYNITAEKVWLYEDKRVVAVGVIYWVGGIPVLPLPFYYASQWGTGIITQIGQSDVQGTFIQNTYQFSSPAAYLSQWKPMAYRFTLDHYQNTGDAAGIEMYRVSPNLNYIIQLGAARYKNYEIALDYRDDDYISITNEVTHSDGTVGKEYESWYKAFAIVNLKETDTDNNGVRNVHLKYEDYSSNLYDFEYGSRYMPTSTIPALYESTESGRGLVHDTTNWSLVWNEQWDDLSVRVQASRVRKWYYSASGDEDGYKPQSDILPAVSISNSSLIGDALGSPIYWDTSVNITQTRTYSNGAILLTNTDGSFETALRASYSWYPYISFQPSAGYGAQKSSVSGGGEIDEVQAAYNSYEYLFTKDTVVFGPDVLNLRATYTLKKSFREDDKYDPPVNTTGYNHQEKVHETEVVLSFNPFYNLNMSIESVYDHRDATVEIPDSQRWSYPVFRTDIYFDFMNFMNPGRENLLSRRKAHFMGLRITNDYVYDTINNRDHSNVFGVTFETGGFDLWLLRRLRYLEVSWYYYHYYSNTNLDSMFYTFKADVQVTRDIFFEIEMESRGTDIQRYYEDSVDENGDSDYIAFEHDILNGLGINGAERRRNSAFNIGYFEAAVILDLHDWELRFAYEMEQRSIIGGVNTIELVNFYDNVFSVSLTLLRFDSGGVGSSPSRFIVDQNRVRSSDVGTVAAGAEKVY